MHTVLEILRKSEALLAQRGITESRLDAEHLLADTLGCQRMDLYLQFDRPLDEEILARLRPRLARRARREPLSYILGHHPFHELELTLRPGALIPRPETEDLVQMAADYLSESPRRILDLGTGSGAIALWMKSRYSSARVLATDRSAAALELARENGQSLGLDVEWIESDWFSSLGGTFELILSNPPYLTESEWEQTAPEVRDHEPREALVAAENGLADLRRIVTGSIPFLKPGGLLALETGINHRDALLGLARERGFTHAWGEDDIQERPRYFFARR